MTRNDAGVRTVAGMSNCGWIKVHRSLIDNPKRVRSSRLALWLYILLSVNHAPGKTFLCGKEITLNPGQGVFSTPDLAKKLCESVSVIRRSLEWFESEQQIEQRKTNQGTVITVLNWDKYQQSEQPNEQQVNNERTTGEQRVNNLPIIRECNNGNNGNNGSRGRHKHGTYQNVLLSDEDLQKLQAEFPGDWQRRIERLSEYMASTGKSYKDHLATIRAWARKDAERQRPIAKNDAASGYARMMEILGGTGND
jgi:DNA-binding transcriptional regulator YhcF (GntR family)